MFVKTLAAGALALQLASAKFSEGAHSALTRTKGYTLSFNKAAALASASNLQKRTTNLATTDNTFALKKVKSLASSKRMLNKRVNETVPEYAEDYGEEFAIEVDFGGEDFILIFDSGSSDTWVAQEGFTCTDENGDTIPEADCYFGSTYNATFAPGDEIEDENFAIEYGDGEYLYGNLGYFPVTVGNITVYKQEVALVYSAYWEGDGVTSGLIGFAYPSITSAYEGTDVDDDSVSVYYNPWIMNVLNNQTAGEQYFSLAIERNVDEGLAGSLAIGGLPTGVSYNGDFVTTDIIIANIEDDPITSTNYSFYSIIPDGFYVQSATADEPTYYSWDNYTVAAAGVDSEDIYPTIIDSGTTLIYIPYDLAAAINGAFDPPAEFIEDEGYWEANATSIPPDVSVVIAGTNFTISPDALLPLYFGDDSSTGLYYTGVQYEEDVYIFGDTFLTNVLAVYDVGNSEMKFASRS